MNPPLRLLGITGSLRRASFNTALLRVVSTLLPQGVEFAMRDLHGVPLYDGDVEARGIPAAVVDLREAIRAADGVIVSSPEYNHGVPGVLKNAVDWSSRGKDQPWRDKPLLLLSASNGGFGGARARVAWHVTFAVLGTRTMGVPEFFLSYGHKAFAPDGSLVDPGTRERLERTLQAFLDFTREHLGVLASRGAR
jgi:chromate reductase